MLLCLHQVVPSIPSAPALASCASTNLRYAFTFYTLNLNLNTMVNTKLHCVQLFIQYLHLIATLMLQQLPHAVEYCHAVRCVLRTVVECSEVFDHSVRMRSITAVLGSYEFRLSIWLGAQGGSHFRAGREHFAGGSTVPSTLSEGLEIELSDFEAENVMLKRNYLRQVVEIVIWGIPTILEIRFMCLFMSLGRILLQGSVSANLFDPVRHQVDLWKVELGI